MKFTMAAGKNNKSKKVSDSKKPGNSCGFSLGCLIIIAAVAAVLFFLFLKPAFKEVGYSYDNLKEDVLDLNDKANNTIARTGKIFRNSKEKYEDIKNSTDEHLDDIKKLLLCINRLVDEGNTVIVIEHNLEVVKTADYVIDLGPEGGEDGGFIVAEGTPEEVSKVTESYTGQYLKAVLNSS